MAVQPGSALWGRQYGQQLDVGRPHSQSLSQPAQRGLSGAQCQAAHPCHYRPQAPLPQPPPLFSKVSSPRSEEGATTSTGHSSRYAEASAMACTVLPRPICNVEKLVQHGVATRHGTSRTCSFPACFQFHP